MKAGHGGEAVADDTNRMTRLAVPLALGLALVLGLAFAPTAARGEDAAVAPVAAPGPDALLAHAKELYDQKLYRASRDALEPLVSDEQRDPEVFFWYGRTLFEEGAWPEASERFSRAIELDPESAVYQFWMGRVEGEYARTLSIFRQAPAARRTLAAFTKSRELDPDYLDPKFGLVRYYFEAPRIVGGSPGKGRAMVDEIAALDPGQGHRARAWVHEYDEQWPEAEREYRKAWELLPDNVGVLEDLGKLLLSQRRFAEAAATYERLLEIDPMHGSAPYLVALCAAETGSDLERARELLDAFIARQPTSSAPALARAHYQRGRIQLRAGNSAAARADFEQALSLDDELKDARAELTRLD